MAFPAFPGITKEGTGFLLAQEGQVRKK